MKQITIEFSFDDTKLEAMSIFLKEKETSIADELERYMESLYKKCVPAAVREFIEKKETEDIKTVKSDRNIKRTTKAERNAVSTKNDVRGETHQQIEGTAV